MNVFHSSTDKGDLYENAPKLPIFLSLIVNYACETDCELAIAITREEKIYTKSKWRLKSWKNDKKENKLEVKTTSDTYIIKCDVVYEHEYTEEDSWFYDVCEKLKAARTTVPVTTYHKPYVYETPKGGFPPKYTSAKGVSMLVKNKTLASTADFLTLGAQPEIPPFLALMRVNMELQFSDLDKYSKALKNYFDTWFVEHFTTTIDVTEDEPLEALTEFLQFHSDKFIYKTLIATLNELKTEYSNLR